MNENWRPWEWDAIAAEFQRKQYLGSRGHCTRELLEAIAGIGPKKWMSFSPRNEPIDRPACGEEGYVGLVGVFDVRPEVTCPKCRALMPAIRPESAPLHERVEFSERGTTFVIHMVGGEFVSPAEYAERVGLRVARAA